MKPEMGDSARPGPPGQSHTRLGAGSEEAWLYRALWGAFALAFALFELYTAFFGVFESLRQSALHLMFALVLAFLPRPRAEGTRLVTLWDGVLAVLVLVTYGLVAWNSPVIQARMHFVIPISTVEASFGIVGLLLLIEAARRVFGWALPALAVAAFLYAWLGFLLPGALSHSGFSLRWVVEHLYYTTQGIFGIPTFVSATYVALFVIFGAFLDNSLSAPPTEG